MSGSTGCDVTGLSYWTVWGVVSGYRVGSPKARVTVVIHISPVLPYILMYLYNPWVLINLSVKWLFIMAHPWYLSQAKSVWMDFPTSVSWAV